VKRAAWVLAVYAALAVAYHFAVPLFEAPDEPGHMEYVAFVAMEKRLPHYGPIPEVPGEGVQGPLFYMLSAPLFAATIPTPAIYREELHRANRTLYRYEPRAIAANRLLRVRRPAPGERFVRVFHASTALRPLARLRWLNLLLGLAAAALTLTALVRVGGTAYGVAGTALLALNPQFLFVSSYVNNDCLAIVVGAAALLLVAHARSGINRRHYLYWAALTAAGFLTKNSTLPGLVAALGALLYFDKRKSRWREAAQGLGLLLALSLPYLIFNTAHRGDPLGMQAIRASAAHMPGPEAFGGLGTYLTRYYLPWTFESYWARFGWMNVLAPGWVFWFFFTLTLIALAGLAKRRDMPKGWTLYLASAAAFTGLAHLWLNTSFAAAQGRHLFAVAPQIAALLAGGLSGWWKWNERRSWALAGILAVVAAALLSLVFTPAYR
jgi:hypothetical protein